MTDKKAPSRDQVTLRLPPELLAQLQAEADRLGISFNQLAVTAFRKFFNQPH